MIAIDFILLALLFLPPMMRKTQLLAFIEVFTNVINSTQVSSTAMFSEIDYKTQFSGEVIYLEHYLNDKYDNILRRIEIDTFDYLSGTYLFNRIESNEPIYVYNNSEYSNPTGPVDPLIDPHQIYLFNEIEVENIETFTVYIPSDVIFNHTIIRSQIDDYRLAGKTYSIEIV